MDLEKKTDRHTNDTKERIKDAFVDWLPCILIIIACVLITIYSIVVGLHAGYRVQLYVQGADGYEQFGMDIVLTNFWDVKKYTQQARKFAGYGNWAVVISDPQ